MGFLVRGGISVGPVYSYEKNIFGSGYINAYLTEQKANNPKILLTRDAKRHYEKTILPRWGQNLGLVRQDGDDLIADSLSPHYWNKNGTTNWENRFDRYRNTIESNIA